MRYVVIIWLMLLTGSLSAQLTQEGPCDSRYFMEVMARWDEVNKRRQFALLRIDSLVTISDHEQHARAIDSLMIEYLRYDALANDLEEEARRELDRK